MGTVLAVAAIVIGVALLVLLAVIVWRGGWSGPSAYELQQWRITQARKQVADIFAAALAKAEGKAGHSDPFNIGRRGKWW